MAGRRVFVEPELDTQEVDDSEEDCLGFEEDEHDDGEEDEDDSLGAADGGRIRGRGLGRKKRGGRLRRLEPVNTFKAEDEFDGKNLTDGLNEVLRGLEQCAKGYFPGVQGSEHKPERKENLKKFHEASVELVGVRIQLEQAPGVVQKVFEDLDLERLAGEEEDDEAFCAMLDQFEEASTAELKKMGNLVTYDKAISKDDEYNACLEVLNLFQKTAKKVKPEPGPSVSDTGPVSTRHSEGLEALTEYIPTHDPVTRRFIVKAVVNRKCGHVYDDASIREFLGGGAKMCPYAGCKQKVVVGDLIADAVMQRKVQQRIREEGLE